jgi:hypothetical protein
MLQLQQDTMYGNDVADREDPSEDTACTEGEDGAEARSEDEGLAEVEQRDRLRRGTQQSSQVK